MRQRFILKLVVILIIMTEKKAKKEERYGCLTKSLEDFLYLSEEQRFEKYKYDVNKYYQRVVKNVNASITDIMIAYTNLPKEQQKKIPLISHVDTLVGYLAKQRLEGTPKKIITSTKKQLIAIIESLFFRKIKKIFQTFCQTAISFFFFSLFFCHNN